MGCWRFAFWRNFRQDEIYLESMQVLVVAEGIVGVFWMRSACVDIEDRRRAMTDSHRCAPTIAASVAAAQ